jgi:hypothetical protein
MKLSDAQHRALSAIVNTHDAAVADELKRWGAESSTSLEKRGLPLGTIELRADTKISVTTLWSLESKGLVTVKAERSEHESLRRGDYGRWIGGTKSHLETTFVVRPTEAGRAVIHAIEHGDIGPQRRKSR